jgi:hypothetical protein
MTCSQEVISIDVNDNEIDDVDVNEENTSQDGHKKHHPVWKYFVM